jgi:hypothetical protein
MLLFSLACCWMTVLGSAAESCTYILLAPVLAWGLLDAWKQRQPAWVQGIFWTSYGLFLSTDVVVWFGLGRPYHSLGIHPLAALMFLIGVLVQEFRLYEQERRARLCPGSDSSLLSEPAALAGR